MPPLRASTPRPALISERNVQEDSLANITSPAILAHITTENYIPPAFDASADAITDEKPDPDDVEIVTRMLHQPAALTVPSGPRLTRSRHHSHQGGCLSRSFHRDLQCQLEQPLTPS
jgi:hypothetical protein